MSASILVSLEEYLATSYRPDQDYVDGLLVERNVGLKDHSTLLGEVLAWFRDTRQVEAFPSQRVQVAATRVRLPDVCVMKLPVPDEQTFTQPPYICIEILSSDDTFPELQERFDDYLAMGVVNVWMLDPATRRGWLITPEGRLEDVDGILRTRDGEVALPIADLFADDFDA